MKGISTLTTQFRAALLLWATLLCYGVHAQITVSGQLIAHHGGPLSGFAIAVSGTESKVAYTDLNGKYTFELQEGGSYEITPLDCPDDPLNGVSTFDLVLISKHLHGIQPFDNPYDIIASDANNSGSLEWEDSIYLRKLILGIYTELPAGKWKYVPTDYVFPDPSDPFNPPYPQSVTISNLANPVIADFIAVRIGDLNSSADPQECDSPTLPFLISGRVYKDTDEDCELDAAETGFRNWIVSAGDGANTFFGSTNNAGEYQIRTLAGNYEVNLFKPNDLWGGCTETVPNVPATVSGSVPVNFGLQPIESCPLMEVSLSAGFLRRCFDNSYEVLYCNNGTVPAAGARVEVTLDPLFEYISASIPGVLVSGNTYSFDLGDVPVGDCGQFFIYFNLSCDAVQGQTHCTEAHVFPEFNCPGSSSWTGPDLKVEGICEGSDVKFTVTNLGTDMLQSSSYIVVEDIVVMTLPMQVPLQLAAGESKEILVPANGSTVRLEIDQAPGHPWNSKASATVEGCGTLPGGGFSTGMVNLFPTYDQSPSEDLDCLENIGSFDPNDKKGLPFGLHEEHQIPHGQPIEYKIRFQNTGTDTAFTVIIRDTLDKQLDITTFRFLGSSHKCDFNLSEEGLATFTFNNILLPDSNVNEIASHGYARYSIAPKIGLADGTRIENEASIYFDFNEAVVTNTTWHTLNSQYLGSPALWVASGISLDVFPNPASHEATFKLSGQALHSDGILQLYSMDGRMVHQSIFDSNRYVLPADALQSGCYMYKVITSTGLPVAIGKLVKAE